ncbi:MAG: HAD-IC family P-type ATPase, partial [Clostridia bacterium]|nr:HAD-IC family P-type ATPase [Clostridia bacterium]
MFRGIKKGNFMDENFLMGIASVGAFAIGEYTEAVAVLIFYGIGELCQNIAIARSRGNIASLMDIRPDYANLLKNGETITVSPESVHIGSIILVKPGEKIPLDGIIRKGSSSLDTSALTGESLPRDVAEGDKVLSGSINKSGLLEVETTSTFGDSTVSKILEMVEHASSNKAESEKFITKFAKIYTPAVVYSAIAVAVIPPIIFGFDTFTTWFYRALNFLIISCPCAL